MVQIPLSGKYTRAFKEKRNKPTHMAHLNFKVFFFLLPGLSSVLIFRFQASSAGFQPGINISPPLKFTTPFPPPLPPRRCFHMHMETLKVAQRRIRNFVSTFHVALGDGKNRMDGQHTCEHMLGGKMGLVTRCNTFSQDSFRME